MATPVLNIMGLISEYATIPPRTLSADLGMWLAVRMCYIRLPVAYSISPPRKWECVARASDTTCRSTHAILTLLACVPLYSSITA